MVDVFVGLLVFVVCAMALPVPARFVGIRSIDGSLERFERQDWVFAGLPKALTGYGGPSWRYSEMGVGTILLTSCLTGAAAAYLLRSRRQRRRH